MIGKCSVFRWVHLVPLSFWCSGPGVRNPRQKSVLLENFRQKMGLSLKGMKYLLQFGGWLLVLILAFPVMAQRGTAPPASLLTGGTHFPPASPSITSQGFGFGLGAGAGLHTGGRSFGQHDGRHGGVVLGTVPHRDHRDREHRRDHFVAPLYGGYYYPSYGYGYGLGYDEDYSSLPGAGTFNNGQQAYVDEQDAPPNDYYYRPRAGANSVRDEARYGEHYTDGREALDAPPQPQGPISANGNENSDVKTLLIFKDGVMREVSNYAIMGQYVFVFSGDRRKIPLAEIDVDATVKANEERGTEFKIPSSSNPS